MDGGWRVSCTYALLPGKTEVLYTNLLEELDTLGSFTSDFVLLDYDNAPRMVSSPCGLGRLYVPRILMHWYGVVVALL